VSVTGTPGRAWFAGKEGVFVRDGEDLAGRLLSAG